MRLTARRYDSEDPVELELDHGRVRRSTVPAALQAHAELPWIAPAFVDIQVNGFEGQEFSSAELTPEGVERIVRRHYAFGVTRICPTLTTQSRDVFLHALNVIRIACESSAEIARAIAAIHLEGPYISAEDGPRGAHPAEHCRPPDWSEFQRFNEAAGGRITLLTLSPEFEGAAEFIAKVTGSGVVASIGHTAANGGQIRAAADAGASLSTHLGNGAHRMLRRHPNYIWDQLAEDRLMASLIVDGHHLPAEVVQTIVRAKGAERCILISDVSGLAGLPVGRYVSSGCELEILPDGRLVIAGQDQLLAGASAPIYRGVENVMHFAGVNLETAINMATRHPAGLLKLPVGGFEPEVRADFVLFRCESSPNGRPRRIQLLATIAHGELVHGSI